MSDFSKLAINQFTTLHRWSLTQAIEGGDVAQLLQNAQDELEPVMRASQS